MPTASASSSFLTVRRWFLVILGVGLLLVRNTPFGGGQSSLNDFDYDNLPPPRSLTTRCAWESGGDDDDELVDDYIGNESEEKSGGGSSATDTATSTTTRPSGCKAIIQRMQEWNDCWRRHLWQLRERSSDAVKSSVLEKDLVCPVTTDNTDAAQEIVGAPLYQYAYYQGQGFGRVVSHTIEACFLAFVLQRPCVINMAPRDPYYTWRSFVQAASYNWDPSPLHAIPNYRQQLEDLAQQLLSIGDNEWPKASFNATKYSSSSNSLVYPMQHKFKRENWQTAIQYYHANATKTLRPRQVLFSPNWGTAWFTRIPLKTIYKEQYQCNYDILKTKLQNALYAPTDLTEQIHHARHQAAIASKRWNTGNSQKQRRRIKEARILPHTTTTTNSVKNNNYGSIHLRMHFLNENRKTPMPKEELVAMVQRCWKRASMMLAEHKSKEIAMPQNWWLLSDNATMAVQVDEVIRKQTTKKSNDPVVNLFHDYDTTKSKGSSKMLSTQHSMKESSRGLFGQENMAGAMADWMVLHSSSIAIVVHEGTFGTTGARGNGKRPRAYCGQEKAYKDDSQPFQIFF